MNNCRIEQRFLFRTAIIFLMVCISFLLGALPVAFSQNKRIPAPEISGGTAWFNVSNPLSIAELKGKVILLDFWTYCCINCMHIIPDLKKLEAKYSSELVVIGVHAAKFNNERDNENIRNAVLRYGIEHPVVADNNFIIWKAYGVKAWPTLVLIDPEGNIVGSDTGEGHFEILDKLIGNMVSDYRSRNLLSENPLPLVLEKFKQVKSLLSFPGKVLADEAFGRLFIADSNHNRIIIANPDGVVIDVAGNGEIGKKDGTFLSASFYHPQGMAIHDNNVYVADTENHLIRKLDLQKKTVQTIAGNGNKADYMAAGGMGTASPLNSPWDLAFSDGNLYIAMAGAHQIWIMDLETSLFQPFAGSGREGLIDGTLDTCAMAQPSGITVLGTRLYFADSEASAVRYIEREKNEVHTVVGRDLFVFGDKDGTREQARLQHPLGVSSYKGFVYVADTYNHKIKVLDPGENTSRTFLGNGRPGCVDGKSPQFYEPGGLSFAGDKLYVADTNNHAIRVIDMKTKEVRTVQIQGLQEEIADDHFFSFVPPFAKIVNVPPCTLKLGEDIQCAGNLLFPPGYHLNPDTPLLYSVLPGKGLLVDKEEEEVVLEKPELPIQIALRTVSAEQSTQVEIFVNFYYCKEDNQSVCFPGTVVWRQPVRIVQGAGDTEMVLNYNVVLP